MIEKFYQDVPASYMGENETFYANTKAKKLVGFKPGIIGGCMWMDRTLYGLARGKQIQ